MGGTPGSIRARDDSPRVAVHDESLAVSQGDDADVVLDAVTHELGGCDPAGVGASWCGAMALGKRPR
jgi:hypothetical protein